MQAMAGVARVLLVAVLFGGCGTLRVATAPADADIRVNGEDISDTGEVKQGVGFGPYTVEVSAPGYKTRKLEVPRDRARPWLKYSSMVAATACGTLGAACGCYAGLCLCNRNVACGAIGAVAGTSIGLASPDAALLGVAVVNNLAADWWVVPGMALCGLLGAWPGLFALLPMVFPVAADRVDVALEREESTPAPAKGSEAEKVVPQAAPAEPPASTEVDAPPRRVGRKK